MVKKVKWLNYGMFKREKQKAILKELIAKTEKGKLDWTIESSLSNIYVAVWKGVKAKLWATEPSVGDTFAHFSLDIDALGREPLFPILGEFSYRKLSPPPLFSPQYSTSKEGPYELLKKLHEVIERQLESLRWLQSNSLSIAGEILGQIGGNPVGNLSVDEIRETIIKEVSKRMTQIEWRVNYKDSTHIYTPYTGFLGKMNIEVEKDVPSWFRLIVEISKKKRVLIQGHKDRGDQQIQIPDKKSKFCGALENLYDRLDKRCRKLACAKRKAENIKKIHDFLFSLD